MSPLQLAVYWRLSLIFVFSAFLFFLDILTAAAVADTCSHNNGTEVTARTGLNQSEPAELSDLSDDWTGFSWSQDSVCSWRRWLCYGQTLFMVGLLLGSLVGGAISDKFGKRPVLLACAFLHSFCGLVPAVVSQPIIFLAVRCVTGLCSCIINNCAFSLAVEWTLPPSRLWPPAVLPFCFSLGTMGGAFLAWVSPNVTWLHLTLSLPQIACLPLFYWIPESPRWLLLKKRTDVLERYRSSSKKDKHCLDQLLDSAYSELQKATEAKIETDSAQCDIVHLRHPAVLKRLFIMSYISVASALTYYGICLNIGSFGVGVYSAQFFSGLSEAPCLLVPLVSLGRRPITILALFLSGAACFLSLLMSKYNCEAVLVMSSALLGKLCILMATLISNLYSIELFPTIVRQRCVSLVNLCFRLGCLANTLVPPSSDGAISLAAMLVYSSGPIIGCGLCLLLPETSGTPLPDSVYDCQQQNKQASKNKTNNSDSILCWRWTNVSTHSSQTEIPSTKEPVGLLL
ncbi:solute carrier family 22 member 6 [Periophthalmus magnuspinnatus]|uniref:solute carrier family 22 member 6 n=1 Tax=Periophthalmus magnuspinnatus TaxID=409849 RepID=UPI00145B6969|nr:solute carrier family 22 member 6 [Periophthalmus magnuspinnatus]